MVSKETFVKLVNQYIDLKNKADEFNKGITKLFGSDSVIYLDWPIESMSEMLETVLMDMGESEEGADWFIWEGLDFFINGNGTEIGEKNENSDNYTYYKLKSLEDYYNYVLKSRDNLETTTKPEDKDVTVINASTWNEFRFN